MYKFINSEIYSLDIYSYITCFDIIKDVFFLKKSKFQISNFKFNWINIKKLNHNSVFRIDNQNDNFDDYNINGYHWNYFPMIKKCIYIFAYIYKIYIIYIYIIIIYIIIIKN